LQGVDVVVHCAASFESAERRAYAINVEGTVRLAESARQAGAQTFVFLSSQSACADALSAYGRSKYAAEKALQEIGGLRVIILRPGLVTGHGSRGLFHRMSRVVESLPVIPVLGGDKSIVQPIHVDDLCEAIFICEDRASEFANSVVNLGLDRGVSLREFLQTIARVRMGRRKATLAVPLWPVEVGIGFAEALSIPTPITRVNLQGLKSAERMRTESDLVRLNLSLRPLEEMVRNGNASSDQRLSLNHRAARVLLIGAGRIGLVHALTLSRLSGVVLCGVVDPKPSQTGLLRGMGLSAPMFHQLEEALAQTRPDAAVIATPTATHLALVRACVSKGLAVLVEKPLALRADQLSDYERLTDDFPDCAVQVGYVMPHNPQIAHCLTKLRAGQFGKVQGFVGVTLLSLIQQRNARRWEVKKEISGGGVLINSGAHVLSMIHAAFGEPRAIEAQRLKLYSTEVEDSMVLDLTYPGFAGRHYSTWSISGFPRQENMLAIWTDEGQLILTGSVGVFIRNDGQVELTHQLDFDLGFNLAPDYAGAGFTKELIELREASRRRRRTPSNVTQAIQLEHMLLKAYGVSREVNSFHLPSDTTTSHGTDLPSSLSGYHLTASSRATPVRRVLDLRDLSASISQRYLNEQAGPDWDEYLILPAQLKGLCARWRNGVGLRITVPDFLNQSRLISSGRYREVLKQIGLLGGISAAREATRQLIRARAATFWTAAMGLLGAGLQGISRDFRGTILLHGYLVDLALSLRRIDMIERMLATCQRMRPAARIGFHTNMAVEALQALDEIETQVDEVSVLTSPDAPDMAGTLDAMRTLGRPGKITLTAEVGLAPWSVHRVAFDAPELWAQGADAVLMGIGADATLARQQRLELEREWRRVFPGTGLPEGIL
jgi:predicted dehydrogenase/uncharacterized protein YbjT (DUF2867 family)